VAVEEELGAVEILHGPGALRSAVREYLATRSEVGSFDDAPWEECGPGVTVVPLP
jgi:DNA mismatch repair protein MutS2